MWYLAVLLAGWGAGYTMMRGSDLYYHLAGGRWILAHGAVPRADPWSFARPGQPWVNHEWLSCVSFAVWERTFGLPSLVYWKWAILALTFVLLFRVLMRLTASPEASFLAVLLGAALAAPFLDIRPHLYTLLAFALMLNLTLARKTPSPWLPALFLVWSNLHAGFAFGLVALPLLLAPGWLAGGARRRRSLLLGAASVAACLMNPYGWEILRAPFLYGFTDSPFRTIAEWHPPFRPGGIRSPLYPWVLGLLGACAAAWILRPDWRGEKGPWLVLLVILVVSMSLRSRRFIALLGLAQALLVAPVLAGLLATIRPRPLLLRAAPAVALLAAVLWLAPFPRSSAAFGVLTAEWTFPVDTCDFLVTNRLQGRVFCYYNWGGYLLHRAGDDLQVFIDGRADTVYDPRTFLDYLEVLRLAPGWIEKVEASGADFFLWPLGERQPGALLATGRWVEIYSDAASVLLARAGRVPPQLHPPPDSPFHRLTRGLQARKRGEMVQAEELLLLALKERPDLLSAYWQLSAVQQALGHPEDARRTLERLAAQHPSLGPSRRR